LLFNQVNVGTVLGLAGIEPPAVSIIGVVKPSEVIRCDCVKVDFERIEELVVGQPERLLHGLVKVTIGEFVYQSEDVGEAYWIVVEPEIVVWICKISVYYRSEVSRHGRSVNFFKLLNCKVESEPGHQWLGIAERDHRHFHGLERFNFSGCFNFVFKVVSYGSDE
jgi:hypothetical protein